MSKRITLDNLKTFLTQLKTNITDPIANDVSTLSVKVHNAENNILSANSNISSVQQALNDKVSKNSKITLPNNVGISALLNDNTEVNFAKIDNINQFNLGSTYAEKLVLIAKNGNAVIYYDNADHTIYHSGNFKKDMNCLFERNNGIINKNENNCFDKETGQFKANESGQYLIMCSGYELTNSSTYVACVLSGISGNQNKLYTSGNSGFTFITLKKDQTLALYTCVAGNINQSCISSDNSLNMLITKIN